jgi:hypothetical protein
LAGGSCVFVSTFLPNLSFCTISVKSSLVLNQILCCFSCCLVSEFAVAFLFSYVCLFHNNYLFFPARQISQVMKKSCMCKAYDHIPLLFVKCVTGMHISVIFMVVYMS